MPISVANLPSSAPPANEVASLLNTIFTAKTSQESLDASYALTNLLIQTTGYRGIKDFNLLTEIKKAAADKKNGVRRESAMLILGALFEVFPKQDRLSEVVFLIEDGGALGLALDALSDKGAVVRDAAQYAVDALFTMLRPESLVSAFLPALLRYLEKGTAKWQGAVGAYALLEKMAKKAEMGTGTQAEEREKDLLREAMGAALKEIIPVVSSGMHDLKNEVAKQAVKAMIALANLITNEDVIPRIPLLIKAMEQPSADTLQKTILALSQTTFVAVVTSPVLALLTPLLERSLNTPTTPQEVLRQTVVVVENLTKLVHDPAEARAFLPRLRPGVQSVKNRASLPEVRELADRALNVMDKAMGDDKLPADSTISRSAPQDVLKVLENEIKAHGGLQRPEDEAFANIVRNYIAEMVCHAVNVRMHDRIPECVGPYLRGLLRDDQHDKVAAKIQAYFIEEDRRKFGEQTQEDENEVEIVNANFSLGYGGRLLLSHTNLRLLKGHRYGLCGRNGVGKSTLMRSIAEGKLEGFPPKEVLRTCFVEHNQGESAELSVLEYCANDPELAGTGKDTISAVLDEFGFTSGPEERQSQKVGSLSGGWKMKLALARAMLMKADVLLLDEPTNHLDVANVKWLQEYLKKHTEITSLIVSHDSGFLDEVCTDIYHYENKKLVLYKGNLAKSVSTHDMFSWIVCANDCQQFRQDSAGSQKLLHAVCEQPPIQIPTSRYLERHQVADADHSPHEQRFLHLSRRQQTFAGGGFHLIVTVVAHSDYRWQWCGQVHSDQTAHWRACSPVWEGGKASKSPDWLHQATCARAR